MSEQIEVRLVAIGSTDAADKAKRWAREQGRKVQTVAAIRLNPDAPEPDNVHREPAAWIVTLAVRDL